MNLVYSTIIIFLVILPGYLLVKGYSGSILSLKIDSLKPIDEITFSIIPGIFIHILGALFLKEFTNYRIAPTEVLQIITLMVTHEELDLIFRNIGMVIIYNSVVSILAYLFGHSIRIFIRLTKLDINFRLFRFDNKWYYILRGESINFPDLRNSLINGFRFPDYIYLDILGKDGQIYKGILHDYYLGSNGKLDLIFLKEASKRNISHSGKSFHPIEGNELIIPFESIVNINLQYKYLVYEGNEKMESGLKAIFNVFKNKNIFTKGLITYKDIWHNCRNENYLHRKFRSFGLLLCYTFRIVIPDSNDIVGIFSHLKKLKNRYKQILELGWISFICLAILFMALKYSGIIITKGNFIFYYSFGLMFLLVFNVYQCVKFFYLETLRSKLISNETLTKVVDGDLRELSL